MVVFFLQSPDGDVIDCVLSHLQPAFDHPQLRGKKPLVIFHFFPWKLFLFLCEQSRFQVQIHVYSWNCFQELFSLETNRLSVSEILSLWAKTGSFNRLVIFLFFSFFFFFSGSTRKTKRTWLHKCCGRDLSDMDEFWWIMPRRNNSDSANHRERYSKS